MAEEQLLERVRREIRERLEETESLIRERELLERALHALEAVREAPRPRPSAPRTRPRRARAGRRAPRGQRRDELLQLVKGSPGLSVSEAARQIGISASQAFTLVRRLEEEGVLRREDGRLIFVAPAASRARGRGEPTVATPGAASAGTEPASAAVEAERPSGGSVAAAAADVEPRAAPPAETGPGEQAAPLREAAEEAPEAEGGSITGAGGAPAGGAPSGEGTAEGSVEGPGGRATPAAAEAPGLDDGPRGPAAPEGGGPDSPSGLPDPPPGARRPQ